MNKRLTKDEANKNYGKIEMGYCNKEYVNPHNCCCPLIADYLAHTGLKKVTIQLFNTSEGVKFLTEKYGEEYKCGFIRGADDLNLPDNMSERYKQGYDDGVNIRKHFEEKT